MKHGVEISQDDLLFYAEGELPQSRHATIDQHLAHCDDCAMRVATLRSTLGSLREIDEGLRGVDLVAGVKKRLLLGSSTAVWPSNRRRAAWIGMSLIGSVAAALLLVLLPSRD